MKKKENVFRILARWFVRWILGPKYEEKWFLSKDKEAVADAEQQQKQPDDSELIVSPGRQIFNRFLERKFAVFSVFVVVVMFLVVFIAPHFMTKYYDAYTETTQKDLPPTLDLMSVPGDLQNEGIKSIDSYSSFTVGLSNAGKVYVWGVGKVGATGVDVKQIPEEVRNAKIAFVAAGQDHVIAIGEDGAYYGWGYNRFGQYKVTQDVEDGDSLFPVPDVVANGELDVNEIKKVTCGYQASAILMKDGTLYIWGNGKAYSNLINFTTAANSKGIRDVDFTLNYVVAIRESNPKTIFNGARGKGFNAGKIRSEINGTSYDIGDYLGDREIIEIRCTTDNVCLLLSDGSIALSGDFPSDFVQVPTMAEGEYFTDIEGGCYHYTGLTNFGHVYSFGGDHYRQAEAPTVDGGAKVFTGAFQNYVVNGDGKLLKTWGLGSYLFGTDDQGANIFERVIAGGRVTMTVGAVAVIIEIIIGVSIGLAAGFSGGWVDIFLMRVAEVFSSIPLYPFLLILSSLLSQVNLTPDERLYMIMVILGVLGWPGFAYVTRAQVLVARESEYVTAAQAMGVKPRRIAFKHILPNIFSVILVNMTLSFAASMQTETSLSFLGFGVNYPQPSWGNMLSRASNATAAINFWWQWVFTSAILILTTVCINTIGDTLRDVMDPKSTNDK